MTETVTVTSRLHSERTFHLVEMQPYRRMDGTEATVRGWQATLLPESTLSAIMSALTSCGHNMECAPGAGQVEASDLTSLANSVTGPAC